MGCFWVQRLPMTPSGFYACKLDIVTSRLYVSAFGLLEEVCLAACHSRIHTAYLCKLTVMWLPCWTPPLI